MNDVKKRPLGRSAKPRGISDLEDVTKPETENSATAPAEQEEPETDLSGEADEDSAGGGRLAMETSENEAGMKLEAEVANLIENAANFEPENGETQPTTLEEQLAASKAKFTPLPLLDEAVRLLQEEDPSFRNFLEEVDQRYVLPSAQERLSADLGEQRDGTYKLPVAIREGYWEGVKLQAELDNVTPEEWCSIRLGEYLENFFFPPTQTR
jgi:hypothetical protein